MRLSHPIQHAADFRIDQPIEILFPLFSAEGGKAVGLGAMGAAILLMANVEGDLTQQVIVVVSLLCHFATYRNCIAACKQNPSVSRCHWHACYKSNYERFAVCFGSSVHF
jgi:hypothetical protein